MSGDGIGVPRSNILLVDDAPANLQLLAGMLRDRNFKVRPVLSGEAALRSARALAPELVLLDVNMPEMDGYEVCRQFKADRNLCDIPVIFLSANDDPLDKVKAFEAGGVDYITKPFHFQEVEARVNTHLLLQRQRVELKASYKCLRELESLRDSLVAMMAHDMRSPLMVIVGYVDLLMPAARAKLAQEDFICLTKVMSSAKKLVEMVTAMLDVSRLEAGQMPLELTSTCLRTAAQEVISSLGSLDGRSSIVIAESSPPHVQADAQIVQRIFLNLLGNALRHTPPDGRITIDFADAGSAVEVSVSDTGAGIPASQHAKIFEKFGQAAVRKAGAAASSGLGLTFCKLAVEAHGGEMGVRSTEGSGSTFWFRLPKAAVAT